MFDEGVSFEILTLFEILVIAFTIAFKIEYLFLRF